ncbi:hypothetical protein SPLC1_S040860 [Arthrospira platensis C1]|nr:hypothetical protein SPLC1_S040860 [Arthrospira platensis C1]
MVETSLKPTGYRFGGLPAGTDKNRKTCSLTTELP